MKTARLYSLLVFGSLFAAFSPITFAQKNLGEAYKNLDHGFQLQPPDRWTQTPIAPTEKNIVAKFVGPKIGISVKGGDMDKSYFTVPIFLVVRIVPKDPKPSTPTPAATSTPAPETKPEKPEGEGGEEGEKPEGEDAPTAEELKKRIEELESKKVPRSFEEWLKKYSNETGISFEGQAKKSKVGKINVDEYSYTVKTIGVIEKNYAMVYHLDGQDIALCYKLQDIPNGFVIWEDLFHKSARSLVPPDAKKAAELAKEAPVKIDWTSASTKDQRKKHEIDVARTSGWALEETKHYFIKYPRRQEAFIKKAKEQIEVLRAKFEEDFPPEKPITELGSVRICGDRHEANDFNGIRSGRAPFGSWNAEIREIIACADPDITGVGEPTQYSYMSRALFNQYMFFRSGETPFHYWFLSGMGDYYGGGKNKGGKLEIAPNNVVQVAANNGIDKIESRLQIARKVFRDGKITPIEQLVRMSAQDFQADYYRRLSEAWALVYFLREGSRSKSWQKSWSNIIPSYVKILTETKDANSAVQEAFKNVDFAAFEAALIDFVKEL